ncbi:MAG: twin-arginine translocase TatA/TatE family subunit [Verrucomicrobia bacterium]|nr:twin-arginine translocase TatA/TatE family subunit [Verrucomicrobiota bacterium]
MDTLAFIPGMQGHTEIILVVFVILLLFGAKKLPELSRSLGKSLGEFKKGQKEGTEPDQDDEVEKKEIVSSEESEKSE